MSAVPQPQPSNADIMAELLLLRALIERALPPPPQPEEWVSVRAVAEMYGRTEQAITATVRSRPSIGRKVRGRWEINMKLFGALWIERHGRLPAKLRDAA